MLIGMAVRGLTSNLQDEDGNFLVFDLCEAWAVMERMDHQEGSTGLI